jgi:hypothetical protein
MLQQRRVAGDADALERATWRADIMNCVERYRSGAVDAIGQPFRNWIVTGWEEGGVPEQSVCWLYCDWEPRPVLSIKLKSQAIAAEQMALFA